jgi:hypothetical protein
MEMEEKLKKNDWVIAVCVYSFKLSLHAKFLCIRVTLIGKNKFAYTWQDQQWPMVNFNPLGTGSARVIINTGQYVLGQTWIQN